MKKLWKAGRKAEEAVKKKRLERRIIILVREEQEDGSILVSSPNVPLFHLLVPNETKALELAIPILTEMIGHDRGQKVTLKPIEALEWPGLDPTERPTPPVHILAEMHA